MVPIQEIWSQIRNSRFLGEIGEDIYGTRGCRSNYMGGIRDGIKYILDRGAHRYRILHSTEMPGARRDIMWGIRMWEGRGGD